MAFFLWPAMHLLLRPSFVLPRKLSPTLLYRAKQQPPRHSPLGVYAPPPLDVEHARKLMLRAVLWTSQSEMGVQQTGATASNSTRIYVDRGREMTHGARAREIGKSVRQCEMPPSQHDYSCYCPTYYILDTLWGSPIPTERRLLLVVSILAKMGFVGA